MKALNIGESDSNEPDSEKVITHSKSDSRSKKFTTYSSAQGKFPDDPELAMQAFIEALKNPDIIKNRSKGRFEKRWTQTNNSTMEDEFTGADKPIDPTSSVHNKFIRPDPTKQSSTSVQSKFVTPDQSADISSTTTDGIRTDLSSIGASTVPGIPTYTLNRGFVQNATMGFPTSVCQEQNLMQNIHMGLPGNLIVHSGQGFVFNSMGLPANYLPEQCFIQSSGLGLASNLIPSARFIQNPNMGLSGHVGPLAAHSVVNSTSVSSLVDGKLMSPAPDGTGSVKYPAPDRDSLIFDPTMGYRYDAKTGLHYDANSGYFFNCKLRVFLYWDSFTHTYLRVENPVIPFPIIRDQEDSAGNHPRSESPGRVISMTEKHSHFKVEQDKANQDVLARSRKRLHSGSEEQDLGRSRSRGRMASQSKSAEQRTHQRGTRSSRSPEENRRWSIRSSSKSTPRLSKMPRVTSALTLHTSLERSSRRNDNRKGSRSPDHNRKLPVTRSSLHSSSSQGLSPRRGVESQRRIKTPDSAGAPDIREMSPSLEVPLISVPPMSKWEVDEELYSESPTTVNDQFKEKSPSSIRSGEKYPSLEGSLISIPPMSKSEIDERLYSGFPSAVNDRFKERSPSPIRSGTEKSMEENKEFVFGKIHSSCAIAGVVGCWERKSSAEGSTNENKKRSDFTENSERRSRDSRNKNDSHRRHSDTGSTARPQDPLMALAFEYRESGENDNELNEDKSESTKGNSSPDRQKNNENQPKTRNDNGSNNERQSSNEENYRKLEKQEENSTTNREGNESSYLSVESREDTGTNHVRCVSGLLDDQSELFVLDGAGNQEDCDEEMTEELLASLLLTDDDADDESVEENKEALPQRGKEETAESSCESRATVKVNESNKKHNVQQDKRVPYNKVPVQPKTRNDYRSNNERHSYKEQVISSSDRRHRRREREKDSRNPKRPAFHQPKARNDSRSYGKKLSPFKEKDRKSSNKMHEWESREKGSMNRKSEKHKGNSSTNKKGNEWTYLYVESREDTGTKHGHNVSGPPDDQYELFALEGAEDSDEEMTEELLASLLAGDDDADGKNKDSLPQRNDKETGGKSYESIGTVKVDESNKEHKVKQNKSVSYNLVPGDDDRLSKLYLNNKVSCLVHLKRSSQTYSPWKKIKRKLIKNSLKKHFLSHNITYEQIRVVGASTGNNGSPFNYIEVEFLFKSHAEQWFLKTNRKITLKHPHKKKVHFFLYYARRSWYCEKCPKFSTVINVFFRSVCHSCYCHKKSSVSSVIFSDVPTTFLGVGKLSYSVDRLNFMQHLPEVLQKCHLKSVCVVKDPDMNLCCGLVVVEMPSVAEAQKLRLSSAQVVGYVKMNSDSPVLAHSEVIFLGPQAEEHSFCSTADVSVDDAENSEDVCMVGDGRESKQESNVQQDKKVDSVISRVSDPLIIDLTSDSDPLSDLSKPTCLVPEGWTGGRGLLSPPLPEGVREDSAGAQPGIHCSFCNEGHSLVECRAFACLHLEIRLAFLAQLQPNHSRNQGGPKNKITF